MKKVVLAVMLVIPPTLLSAQSKPASSTDKWTQSVSISPIDDSKTVVLSLRGENAVQGWLKSAMPSLIIRCKEGETSLYVATGMAANPVRTFQEYPVRLRLDSRQAFEQMWSESTTNESLFAPNPIALARGLATVESLLFEFTPLKSNPAIARFDVRGLGTRLRAVEEACGAEWSRYDKSQELRRQMQEERQREAELSAKLGSMSLGDPVDVRGLSIPMPRGASPKVTLGPPDIVMMFIIATEDGVRHFYRGAMEIFGWDSVPGREPCWSISNAALKTTTKLCVDFPKSNTVVLTVTPSEPTN